MVNEKEMRAGTLILISDNMDFEIRSIKRDE